MKTLVCGGRTDIVRLMQAAFRRKRAQQRFEASYATVLAQWPLPAEEVDVATSFGTTRVRVCGAGPPLVLLPGAQLTSLSWFANVAELGAAYRLYLVDSLGEIGMSHAGRTLQNAEANVEWLTELLDELALPDAHFAGASRGGWLAMMLAAAAPRRVRTVAVFDPPGLVKFSIRWYAWLVLSLLRALVTGPPGGPVLAPFLGVLFRIMPQYRMRVTEPELITDAQLQQITAPMRSVLGGRSAFGSIDRRAARAALPPHASVEVVQHAAHDFALSMPSLVTRRIMQTCQETS